MNGGDEKFHREAAKKYAERVRNEGMEGVSFTKVAPGTYAFDFKLPFAEDAPFSSSFEYDVEHASITAAALRFPQQLLGMYPDDELKDKMQDVLSMADAPDGAPWTTYIRGDARVTGPHIMAPGNFSDIHPYEFSSFLGRVVDAYYDVFVDSPGTPAGISDDAYAQAERVESILRGAGYEDLDPWYDWEDREAYLFDFKHPANAPGTSIRAIGTSSLGVEDGVVTRFTLRFPRMDTDEYTKAEASAVGERLLADTGLGAWCSWRHAGGYIEESYNLHIEYEKSETAPRAVQAARQIAQAPEAFADAVFDVRSGGMKDEIRSRMDDYE